MFFVITESECACALVILIRVQLIKIINKKEKNKYTFPFKIFLFIFELLECTIAYFLNTEVILSNSLSEVKVITILPLPPLLLFISTSVLKKCDRFFLEVS